jgi:hypothetical protein
LDLDKSLIMITKVQLTTILLFSAFIWGIVLFLDGISISLVLLKPITSVTGVVIFILAFFDKWAWHWKIFYPWLVATPYIEGTWKGEIKSNWNNLETYQGIENIDAFFVIRQKFSSIHAQLITNESSSELLSGEIIKNPDETWQFIGIYRNTPKLSIRERSPIHHGAMILNIVGHSPYGLEGQYWTDRDTKGELSFFDYNKDKFSNFTSAKEAIYIKRPIK